MPVADERADVPVTEVVPVTVRSKPATVNVVPVPTVRLPLTVMAMAVVAEHVPERVRSPLIVPTLVRVLAPLPLSVR